MEEKKVPLPKPPKALRKTQPIEEKKAEPVEVEKAPLEEPKIEETVKQNAKPKRKTNFEPLTNWAGLFVSLAVFAVFIFLLVIN